MLMIDKAASRNLQEQTATTAMLANDAKEIHLNLPVPLTADTRTGTSELAPHQTQLLPALRDSIRDVLPAELHAQTNALPRYAVSKVPSQDDVTATEFDHNQESPTLRTEPTSSSTTRLLPNPHNTLPWRQRCRPTSAPSRPTPQPH